MKRQETLFTMSQKGTVARGEKRTEGGGRGEIGTVGGGRGEKGT